jgi:hypothetical protein
LIRRLVLDSPRTVRSGERIEMRIVGSAGDLAPADLCQRRLGFRVRDLQAGQRLFQSSTGRLGIDLPPSGEFEIAVSLQMNVTPGLYSVDAFVWNAEELEISHAGPSLTVQIVEGQEFQGTIQLNPEVKVRTLEPTDGVAAD